MSLFLKPFESFFSNEPSDPLYIENHQFFVDDLQRWFEVCSSAFERSSFIYNTTQDCICLLSDSWIDLLGYSTEELVCMGSHFMKQLLHPDDLKDIYSICEPALNKLIKQHSANNGVKFTILFNFRIKHKNGHYLTLDCMFYPIYFIGGSLHFSIVHVRPIKRLVHVNFQVYFMYENLRFIYNRHLKDFIPENKSRLDEQEILILGYTAKGNKEYEIASLMDLDVNRIKYLKKRLMKKMSVNSMPEALYFALKMNII